MKYRAFVSGFWILPLFHGEIQARFPFNSKSLIINTKGLWTKTLRFHFTHNLKLTQLYLMAYQVSEFCFLVHSRHIMQISLDFGSEFIYLSLWQLTNIVFLNLCSFGRAKNQIIMNGL